jgi:hypothetical protein
LHYTPKYHEQGLAFAPLAANSFGQLGPEFLRFLWTLADHAARNYIPVPLPVLPSLADADSPDDRDSPQVVRFKRLRGQIFVQARLHLLTAVYEAVTHRVYGRTFALQADARYWETLRNLSMVWSPQTDPSPQSQSPSQPLSEPLPAFPAGSYGEAAAALPHSTHMPAAPIFNQWTHGAFPPSGETQSSPSAQPSSAGGDRSCVDGHLPSPQLSPAAAPWLLCVPPHLIFLLPFLPPSPPNPYRTLLSPLTCVCVCDLCFW